MALSKQDRERVYCITWVVIIQVCWVILFGCGVAYCVDLVRDTFGIGVDSTDQSSWDRSGLKIYTDAKTGQQYVGGKNLGLTPRIDENGEPMRASKN
jgi:hypothetical protein